MSEIKKTQKERRAESDSRIIDSAIKCFGEYGYANAKMVDIARGADVTSGLLIHRFESKENLLYSCYLKAIDSFFSDSEKYLNIPDAFFFFIKQIKNMQAESPDIFNFWKVILNSFDLPESFMEVRRKAFEKRIMYKNLKDAQEQGLIIQSDRFNLFQGFLTQVFNQLSMCEHYGVDCPDDSFFLRIFNYSETEYVKRERHLKAMLDAIIQTVNILSFIDLRTNTSELLRQDSTELPSEFNLNAKARMDAFVKNKVVDFMQDEVRDFLNLDTVNERFKNKNLLIKKFTLVYGYDALATLVPVTRDKNENVLELLAGIQIFGMSEN